MRNYLVGLKCFFTGVSYSFKEKNLRRVVILSCLSNMVIFFLVLTLVFSKLLSFLHSHLSEPHFWYQYILNFSAKAVGLLGTLVFSVLLVYVASSVLLIGWAKFLSQGTLIRRLGKHLGAPGVQVSFFGSIGKAMAVFLLGSLGFMLTFWPGLALIGLFFSSLVMTIDMMDYGFSTLGWANYQSYIFVKKNFLSVLGFATGLTFLLAIPILNVMILPSVVVAANYLIADIKGPVEKNNT